MKLEKGGSKMALQEDRIQLAMRMTWKKKTTGSACEPACLDIVRVPCSKHPATSKDLPSFKPRRLIVAKF